MLKKIILGLLFTTVSAALIAGGVYRTEARFQPGGETGGENRRQNLSESSRNGSESVKENRGNGKKGRLDSEEDKNSLSEVAQVLLYHGTVKDVTVDYLLISTDSGLDILIENRAWRFAQDAGFIPDINDSIELSGYVDDKGIFEVSWISNLTNGIFVEIRDENVRPNWAGGGGGNRNGQS